MQSIVRPLKGLAAVTAVITLLSVWTSAMSISVATLNESQTHKHKKRKKQEDKVDEIY